MAMTNKLRWFNVILGVINGAFGHWELQHNHKPGFGRVKDTALFLRPGA